MKMKETFKRFRAMQKHTGGFTLVELIVVIAILAILAGVAIPAYSGYITKANEAADQQLLSAVNRAFAAACIENGFGAENVTGAAYDVATHTVSAVKVGSTAVDDEFNSDYLSYFMGNETTAFKVVKSVVFDSAKHIFVDPASVDSVTVSYNGNPVSLPSSAIDAYNGSNWGNVASSNVLGLVGSVTEFAAAVDNDTFLSMLEDPNYLNAAAAALGVDPEDYGDTVLSMTEAAADKWAKENNITDADAIEEYKETIGGQIMANNAVLVAAQNANANKDSLIAMLTENDGKSAKANIAATMGSSPADGLAQASMAYGLYTSYMLDKDPNYDTSTNPDPTDVMDILDDPGFQAYLKTEDAKTDLDGFTSVLDAAGKNTGNGVGIDIVQNGFADNESLEDLMQQILGK